jgi:hypothetical protein
VVCPPRYNEGEFDALGTFETLQKSWHLQKWNLPLSWEKERVEEIRDFRTLLFEIVEAYRLHYHPDKKEVDCWIDHTPNNLENIGFLKEIFPDARFIHIVRDGRGVAASFKEVIWGPNTVLDAACHWSKKIAVGCSAEVRDPSTVTMVRYEDILTHPEKEIRRLCQFVGIDFRPEMLEAKGLVVPEYTRHQHRLVGSAPQRSKVEDWKERLTKREIEIFEYECGTLLKTLGYETMHETPKRATKVERLQFYLYKRKRRIIKEFRKVLFKLGLVREYRR